MNFYFIVECIFSYVLKYVQSAVLRVKLKFIHQDITFYENQNDIFLEINNQKNSN